MLGVAAPVPSPWGLARAPAKHGVWSRYRMLVFFLKKIQKEKCKFLLAYFSGCAYTRLRYGGSSSVGRAPGCGPGGRGFKSHLSPHKEIPPLSSGVFLFLPPGCRTARGLNGPCRWLWPGARHGCFPFLSRAREGQAVLVGGWPRIASVRTEKAAHPAPFRKEDAPVRGRQLPGVEKVHGLSAQKAVPPSGRQWPLRPPDGPPLPKQGLLRTKHPITERGAAW